MIHQGVLWARQLRPGMGLSVNANKGKSKVSDSSEGNSGACARCMQEEGQSQKEMKYIPDDG